MVVTITIDGVPPIQKWVLPHLGQKNLLVPAYAHVARLLLPLLQRLRSVMGAARSMVQRFTGYRVDFLFVPLSCQVRVFPWKLPGVYYSSVGKCISLGKI